jgi:hypothetical protein
MLRDIDISVKVSVSRFSHPFVTRLYYLCSRLLVWLTFIAVPLSWGQFPTLPIPAGSTFTLPPPNACQSRYDQFYISEPGVYAYWALCEAGSSPNIYDYAGRFDLTPASNAWSSGPRYDSGGDSRTSSRRRNCGSGRYSVFFYCEPEYSHEYTSGNLGSLG